MLRRSNLLVIATVFTGAALSAPDALAQGGEAAEAAEPAAAEDAAGTAEEGAEGDAAAGTAEQAPPAGDQAAGAPPPGQWTQQEEVAVDEALAADSPVELAGQTYYLVGARYRGIVVPKFMMNLFGDGGTTVYINSFGPEFGIRKDGFEYTFAMWWAGYYMDPTPFKASNDDDVAWEIVSSDINVMYLTADFMWTHDFSPEFGLNYGLGAGFGIVWGKLFRTQAYPPGGTNDPYDFVECGGVGAPDPNYCGDDNDHYSGYDEPSWADGGSKPVIFPWFGLQTGFRVKPHRNFVGRIDLGFGVSGFYFGVGLDYGI